MKIRGQPALLRASCILPVLSRDGDHGQFCAHETQPEPPWVSSQGTLYKGTTFDLSCLEALWSDLPIYIYSHDTSCCSCNPAHVIASKFGYEKARALLLFSLIYRLWHIIQCANLPFVVNMSRRNDRWYSPLCRTLCGSSLFKDIFS